MTSLTDSALPTTAEVERLARQVAGIEEVWGNLFPLRLKGHVRPFESQPYLFLAAFPRLTRQDAELVAVAGRLYLNSMLVLDEVIDRSHDSKQTVTGTLRAEAMRFEAYQLLYRMFPPQAAFWQHFRTYLVDYSRACIEERRFAEGQRPWSEYTEELALFLARGKNGVAKATIAALVELAGDDRHQASLTASVIDHYTAWQMWDDLCDWKVDLRAGVPSLLLARVLHEQPPEAEREALIKPLAREIYYGGHARYVLDMALDLLADADREAAVVDEQLAWREVIARLRAECSALRQDVERIVRGNVERAREQPAFELVLPAAEDPRRHLAEEALGFVVEQWRYGFGEARHIMHLTHAEGFSAASEYHFGDVFQRALIADALCDANEALDGTLQPVVEHEARYLLSRCETTGVGGWRYFQTVSEVAPDADDLGQVMQVLLRAGLRGEAEQSCEGPLAVLLRDRARPDGSIETWIVPAADRTPEQERQLRFNEEKWGTGPDNEVVANLLYALTLYDRERFADTVRRGIGWLATRQEADGSWPSTWYYGPFYGTYVCLRLLAAVCPEAPEIAAAARFLESTQRIDGGWGAGAESDPLSSALAILGLRTAEGRATPPSPLVQRGMDYLTSVGQRSDPWPEVRFIKPRLNDPYGSRTMTAAYMMKAAFAAYTAPCKGP
jgi:squalene-hopene/tetraprenyl-beta-curcumene cyclase